MYKHIVDSFDVREGDIVYLSSDITKLAYLIREKEKHRFDPVVLLGCFQNAVGESGTLMLPTFCFDFSNTGRYDYRKSKGNSGVLGNVALTKCAYQRTSHPMHSFAVWGRDAQLLASMTNRHSYGEDSPFAYCKERNVKQIMLGTDYRHSMTFIHYVETACKVPYRFPKSFRGIYVDSDGNEEMRQYEYAARRLDVGTEEKFNRIGNILEGRRIAKKVKIAGMEDCLSHICFLGDSYPVIRDDILNNQCRNIYDFSITREELFRGYERK